VSIARITFRCVIAFFSIGTIAANPAQEAASGATHEGKMEVREADPALSFRRGQIALNDGKLDEAEYNFRQVLQLDPQSGAAYANLGVVSMRRKQWDKALEMLKHAQRLMPREAGIRLNIGLAYFRQHEFLKAIQPFESVLHDQPNATQPRYLLGLCYFFDERWNDATTVLEPLWAQESEHLPYLYVLANAAHRAGRNEVDDRATGQLIRLGNNSVQYHLFVGKYYLNREQYDEALKEFSAAATMGRDLPFVHFNLGLSHLKKQEYSQARDEFLKDSAIEPDLALNYEELGNTYWLMEQDADAEKSYQQALKHDSRLVESHLGLAKIYQRQQKFAAALSEADAAVKLDPERPDTHYIRGQVLLRLGRKVEAQKEQQLAAAREHQDDNRGQAQPVPSPELVEDLQ